MSSLKSRLKEITKPDPRLEDPDFLACLRAREAMQDPCGWTKGKYTGVCYLADDQGQKPVAQACWAGHILLSLGHKFDLNTYVFAEASVLGENQHRIALKLGFSEAVDLHMFNDSHTHEEVLAEFDRRLAKWKV